MKEGVGFNVVGRGYKGCSLIVILGGEIPSDSPTFVNDKTIVILDFGQDSCASVWLYRVTDDVRNLTEWVFFEELRSLVLPLLDGVDDVELERDLYLFEDDCDRSSIRGDIRSVELENHY